MSSVKLKQKVQTVFKLNGLQLRLDAAKYLADLLVPVQPDVQESWIEKILSQVEKQKLKTSMVDLPTLEQAVSECTAAAQGLDEDDLLNLINCFDVPRFTFSTERKKFLPDNRMGKSSPELLPPAGLKNQIFLDRYTMLQQRTARHDLFTGSATVEKKYHLKPVEFLLGTTNRLDDVIVLGMLTQLKYGCYYLEDPSGVVKLDMTETKFHTGLYTENCFVLAEGWYDDEVFHVLALGFPPAESNAITRKYFGNTNFFGGPSETTLKVNEKMLKAESSNTEAMFVFLSDVWLDEVEVQNKLSQLFEGYMEMPPTAFVFCGNFLNNRSSGAAFNNSLKEHLKMLGEMLTENFHSLAVQSKFLFIPGPADPGSANIFPRPPLPSHLTSELRQMLPNAEFLSNPARIQYCTQQIVVFREDVVTKMCRNSIYFPETGDIPSHFAKTITCQGHLAPLPLHTSPVYWDFDRSMYLYPLPDLVVTADKFQPFTAQNLDCKVINPGSFMRQEFSFKTFIPSTQSVEDSQIPGDEDQDMS